MPLAHLKSSIQEKTVFARTKSSMITNESDQSATKPLPNRTCSKNSQNCCRRSAVTKSHLWLYNFASVFKHFRQNSRNLLRRFLLGTGWVQLGDFHAVEIYFAELSCLILVWFFVSNYDLAIIAVTVTCGKQMDGQFGKPKGPNVKHSKSIHILTRLKQCLIL